jgi:hypothetical protein
MGASIMASTNIFKPAELCVLASALDQYCDEIGIDETDKVVRKALARRVMYLSASGVRSLEGLKEALRSDRLM